MNQFENQHAPLKEKQELNRVVCFENPRSREGVSERLNFYQALSMFERSGLSSRHK